MGQYYKPIALDEQDKPISWVYSHRIKEKYTREDGTTFTCGQGLKLMEHSYIGNKLMTTVEQLLTEGNAWYKKKIVWAGDYANGEINKEEDGDNEKNPNLYDLATDDKEIKTRGRSIAMRYRYIVNHTKKQYVDKIRVREVDGYKVHPLSLLTCEGCGRGGGDYRGVDKDNLIGSWSRDVISVEEKIPEGYEQLHFNILPD